MKPHAAVARHLLQNKMFENLRAAVAGRTMCAPKPQNSDKCSNVSGRPKTLYMFNIL